MTVVKITTPIAYASPRSAVLATLFTKMLMESLNQYVYAAHVAGLTFNVSDTVTGFEVRTTFARIVPLVLQKKHQAPNERLQRQTASVVEGGL